MAADNDNENDDNYEDEGRSDDELPRKIGMLRQKCVEYKRIIKRLKMDLRLLKSHVSQTKCQIRIDYDWDGKETNFADLVLTFVKDNCFHVISFLKDGWMVYDDGPGSFLSFVQEKVKIPEGADYKDQLERVICPTIHTKYATIRCNLNNEI